MARQFKCKKCGGIVNDVYLAMHLKRAHGVQDDDVFQFFEELRQ